MDTKLERTLRTSMIFNVSQDVAAAVENFNKHAAEPGWFQSKACVAAQRKIIKSAERLAKVVTAPVSDGLLRYFGGQEAVDDRARAARGRGLGKVVNLRSAQR